MAKNLKGIKYTKAMEAEGMAISEALYDVTLADAFGEVDLDQYHERWRDLIVSFLHGNILTVTAIYIAMERVRGRDAPT